VTFFALLEDFYPGRLTVKDRDKTHRITGVIFITTGVTSTALAAVIGVKSIAVTSGEISACRAVAGVLTI
jgi:hypothetical protein